MSQTSAASRTPRTGCPPVGVSECIVPPPKALLFMMWHFALPTIHSLTLTGGHPVLVPCAVQRCR